jgi:hypothetical protein
METIRPNFHPYKLMLIWGISFPLAVQAEGLANQINSIFGQNGVQLAVTNPQFSHQAHFSSSSLSALGILTQQLAASAVNIPAISTVPGLTYTYNPSLQAFERSKGSLGSIYIERPFTLGKGRVDAGFSYTYVGFDTLNGQNLNGLSFDLEHGDCCGTTLPSPNNPSFEEATVDVRFNQFSLQSHIFNFSATYGITDKWDVNILLPVMQTSLDLTATAHINDVPFAGNAQGIHNFSNGTKTETKSSSGSNFGVGDLQLRTKYHFLNYKQFNMAGGLNLRLQSGSNSDFQGLGYSTVTPYLSFSQALFDIIDLHATAGVEFNNNSGMANGVANRIRYAGGATFQLIPEFALITDFIGTSNIGTTQISTTVPQFTQFNATPSSFLTTTQAVNTNTLNLALGFKFVPYKSVVGFFNVFLPLNSVGLQADVIPTGGVQVGF